MDERFKQVAAMVDESTRFFSSTTVVLHNVTHKVSEWWWILVDFGSIDRFA